MKTLKFKCIRGTDNSLIDSDSYSSLEYYFQATGDKDQMQHVGVVKSFDIYEDEIYELKLMGVETHVEFQDAVVKWSDAACGFGFYINEPTSSYTWVQMNDKNILSIKYKGNIYTDKS